MKNNKYTVMNNQIVTRATMMPIPEDEPVLIIRAKDFFGLQVLDRYIGTCINNLSTPFHIESLHKLRDDFAHWRDEHKDVVAPPSTNPPGTSVDKVRFYAQATRYVDCNVLPDLRPLVVSLIDAGYRFYADIPDNLKEGDHICLLANSINPTEKGFAANCCYSQAAVDQACCELIKIAFNYNEACHASSHTH